jgi:hypothetical protein
LNTILGLPKDYQDVQVILVDYDLPLAGAITEGNYNWVNTNITEQNFPRPQHEHGKHEIPFRLFHFDKNIASENIIQRMGQKDFRPVALRQLLAWGKVNPELQCQFPIIALGSVWRHSDGRLHVPGIWGYSSDYYLVLSWLDDAWDPYSRFLASCR